MSCGFLVVRLVWCCLLVARRVLRGLDARLRLSLLISAEDHDASAVGRRADSAAGVAANLTRIADVVAAPDAAGTRDSRQARRSRGRLRSGGSREDGRLGGDDSGNSGEVDTLSLSIDDDASGVDEAENRSAGVDVVRTIRDGGGGRGRGRARVARVLDEGEREGRVDGGDRLVLALLEVVVNDRKSEDWNSHGREAESKEGNHDG